MDFQTTMSFAEVREKLDGKVSKEFLTDVLNEVMNINSEDLQDSGVIGEDDFTEWVMNNKPGIDPDSYADLYDDAEMVAEYLLATGNMDNLKDIIEEFAEAFDEE